MKKVLVIGANSYIGKKFLAYANENSQNKMQIDMTSASGGEWLTSDLSKYDTILHLSAIVHRKEKKSMEPIYGEVNYQLPVNVAIKAKESGVKQFIFMSSAAVYGNEESCITKDTPLKPSTYYGRSKLKAEYAIKAMESDKFKVAIIRPPMVYGNGCKGNYARLKKIAKYIPIYPNYHNKRSVICVINLIDYINKVINLNQYGIFHPQDNVYFDVCNFIINEREKIGKRTLILPHFNFFITLFVFIYKPSIRMFQDFYYQNIE